jgi:hypothetical protein
MTCMGGKGRQPTAWMLAVVGLLGAVALLLGVLLHPLAVDDAYITYRYAHNLAKGTGFTYNAGRAILSTTAPLYALLLALGAWSGFDLPSLANVISAIALWVGAMLNFALGYRERTPWVGAFAALLYILSPLLWLSLGLETALFLSLCLGAVLAYRRVHLYGTAALLALATLTRGDGLILTAVIAADYGLVWLRGRCRGPNTNQGTTKRPSWPKALVAVGIYAAVMLPFVAWLTWQFGSPLPATLGAKVSQSELGVTGFYAHTTYLQGLGILVRARLAQSPLYLLFVPAVLAGLVAMWRHAGWVRLLAAWAVVHLVGYAILGVTPYYWYYAPLVPGLVGTAALGVVAIARWTGRELGRWGMGFGWLWAAALVVTFLWSLVAMVRGLDGPVPPPENPVSKVLPEAKAVPYEQAGRWLREHTPADALVGVTEVGIMGYHSERPMIDFLGLLEPEVAEAMGRGDLYWALLRYQPDYLALTAISPLYAFDLRADPWFQVAYIPVQTIDDPLFWGSPVTIYERRLARTPLVEASGGSLPLDAVRLDMEFGNQIRLLGAVPGANSAQPGEALSLILYWEALGAIDHDYTVFVHLLGTHERVIAQRDAPPGLGARPTSQWTPGQMVADPYLLALPEAAFAPDQAVWEVGLYNPQTGIRLLTADGGDNLRFGRVAVVSAVAPMHLDFGSVFLNGYELDRLALLPGESLGVRLHWLGTAQVQIVVQLVDETGNVAVTSAGNLENDMVFLSLDRGAPPGAYDLEVLVIDPATGEPLPLLGADGQQRGDRARLTKVRVYP